MNLFFSVAHAVAINPNLPGTNPITTGTGGPGGFVANFYQFALMIGGVLAFGAVVYGGVKYITAAGNPSGQSEAKEWITSALLGLLLLGGAYFILNVINPDLLNLNLPNVQSVSVQGGSPPPGSLPSCTGCGAPLPSCNMNNCPSGQLCVGGNGSFGCQPVGAQCTGCGTPNPACAQNDCPSGEACSDPQGTGHYSCVPTGV